MKPNPHRTLGARLLMFAVLNCCTPLLADAPHHEFALQWAGRIEQNLRRESGVSAPAGDSVCERTSALSSRERRFGRARAYLLTLLQDGDDSQSLDWWLDALGEDTIVQRMPGDLVGFFYGEPLDRQSIVVEGAHPELRSIVRSAIQVERPIVRGGEAVRIGV